MKLSDTLVLDARLCSKLTERSIAGQIEFWAALGKAMEPLLRFDEVLRLRQRGAVESLSDCLEAVGTKVGDRRLGAVLRKRSYPHYEADPNEPGVLVRIDAKGKRERGRFVKRQFVPAK